MSVIDTLITDRTQADVNRAKALKAKILSGATLTVEEEAEYLAGLKGAYNYTDRNRVGTAVLYLQTTLNDLWTTIDAYLAAYGVAPDNEFTPTWPVLSLSVKTDWATTDVLTPALMATYLDNVDTVTGCIVIDRNLPASMKGLTYAGANEIERCLAAEYDAALAWESEKKELIENTAAAWFYSGEIYGGEF